MKNILCICRSLAKWVHVGVRVGGFLTTNLCYGPFMNTGPLFPMDIKIHYWGSKNSNLMNMKNVQNDILLCMHRAIS